MRADVRAFLVGAAGCAALVAAGPAFGATYCVHQSGTCAAGQVDEGGDLQQALGDAAATASSTVLIGQGIYAQSTGFEVLTSNDVTVVGAGRDQTFLEATDPGATVMRFTASDASVLSSMTLAISSNVGVGLYLNGATARDVAAGPALGQTGSGGELGAHVVDGATLRDSTIAGGSALSSGAGVRIDSGTGTLLDHDVISGYDGVNVVSVPAALQRSTVTESIDAVRVANGGGDLTADDDLLVLGPGGPGIYGIRVVNGASATVRSTTLYSVFGTGTAAASSANSSGDHSSLTVLDSILWNAGAAFAASASAGTSAITANYDDVIGTSSGGLNATVSTSNLLMADPLFVAPGAGGDYHLRFGSPAIDSGGDCATTCQTVPDLAGVTRPVDGDGDGVATRDMGAYEYARQAPAAMASVDRSTALTGELVAFSGAGSSDPDPGDALAYAWSFDDGSSASGQDVTHSFTTAGSHTATLTVTDPTGLTATATALIAVSAPPVVKDTTAPSLTKVSLSPSAFAVARGSTATAARRHRGTHIRFTLSEAARVVATFERRKAGVRRGGHCVAKTRKHRHGKACTRYVRAGVLTRRSEPAGADSIAFTGRLGRQRFARARYRLRLRATDAAGNRSPEKQATFRIV